MHTWALLCRWTDQQMIIHSAWALVFRVHCTADMLQYWLSVLVRSVAQAYGNLRPWQKLVLLVLHPPAQYRFKIWAMCVKNLWPQGDLNVLHICWQDITTFSGSEPCWVTLPTPAAAASAARSCQAVCSCRLDGEYISMPTCHLDSAMSILVSEGECVTGTWSTEPDMRRALSAKEPWSGDILTHLFAHGIVCHRNARHRHAAIRISGWVKRITKNSTDQ